MWCSDGLYSPSFTPITNIGASAEGAVITTFWAPPATWLYGWWHDAGPVRCLFRFFFFKTYLSFVYSCEDASGFNHSRNLVSSPRNLGRVTSKHNFKKKKKKKDKINYKNRKNDLLSKYFDGVSIDDKISISYLYLPLKLSMSWVIPEEVSLKRESKLKRILLTKWTQLHSCVTVKHCWEGKSCLSNLWHTIHVAYYT